MAKTFGYDNPLRYRGYVYDNESGLYYLQSRFYNPALGRFLNIDSYVSTGQGVTSNNAFVYCLNNPIILTDIRGRRPEIAYATYFDGVGGNSPYHAKVADNSVDVYIVSAGEGEEYANAMGGNGTTVIVEDLRDNQAEPDNPNIKIYNSYLITDSQVQREILAVLINYNTYYPSEHEWSREVDEMEYEWDYHNVLANAGIRFSQTGHVDLDMKDKNKSAFQKIWESIYAKGKDVLNELF